MYLDEAKNSPGHNRSHFTKIATTLSIFDLSIVCINMMADLWSYSWPILGEITLEQLHKYKMRLNN